MWQLSDRLILKMIMSISDIPLQKPQPIPLVELEFTSFYRYLLRKKRKASTEDLLI